jgi:hypothetical protein
MSSKGLRLRFKGEPVSLLPSFDYRHDVDISDQVEKKKKKSKRSRIEGGNDEQGKEAGPPDGNEQAWVAVERLTDLAGPSFIFQRFQDEQGSSSGIYCLAVNPALNRVEAHSVQPASIDEKTAQTLDLEEAEVVHDESTQDCTPTDVTQVWVATRVLDTPSNAPRYTLRSSESRFITAERDGGLRATAEARGPLEEFTLIETISGKYCFKSTNETLLNLDEMAGGKMVVRSDFEVKEGQAPGPSEQWEIRVQWKFREQARKKEEGEKPLRERDTSFKKAKVI